MIKELIFNNEGSVYCKSVFYTAHNVLNQSMIFKFNVGINKLIGDIDSGNWGISYLLPMCKYGVKKDNFLFPLTVNVDGKILMLEKLSKECCYMDEKVYPLFSSKHKTVKKLIELGVRKSGIGSKSEEICKLFRLSPDRINRPISQVGNERFRAMAAVGYAYGNKIFCFPWLSKKMFDYYTNNILWTLDILESLGMIVIIPVGKP